MQIKLLKTHTDDDVTYAAGVTIEVDDPTAAWLVANEIGERIDMADAPQAQKAPAIDPVETED